MEYIGGEDDKLLHSIQKYKEILLFKHLENLVNEEVEENGIWLCDIGGFNLFACETNVSCLFEKNTNTFSLLIFKYMLKKGDKIFTFDRKRYPFSKDVC